MIANGDTKEALVEMDEATNGTLLHNEVALLLGQYRDLLKKRIRNLNTPDEDSREISRINDRIFTLLDLVDNSPNFCPDEQIQFSINLI